ncbi:MORN repeat-containing protein 5-like [Osmia bicornis bicornis]|uniref:MORN repeat-containing protein 5-like n=1 Tax=Osmia bicornis bicornis TaxID=1437191 RepID=UPI0010F74084|nr:MORN repeat-containing protein 5-like [Osmia bicornis bicornis]
MDFLLKNPEDENVHFIDDSKYKGTWNALGMEGIGKYVLPHNAMFEGELRDSTFHGHGSMYWIRGQRMDGVWYRGQCNKSRYIFNDGLTFRQKNWKYCKFPDRRYYACLKYGLRPAGATLRTNNQAGLVISPNCYDAGIGIFNPRTNCIVSYRNPNKVLEIPNDAFVRWIESNCLKAWSEPTGYREDLYENWYFTNFDTAILSKLLPFSNNSSDSWWRRYVQTNKL